MDEATVAFGLQTAARTGPEIVKSLKPVMLAKKSLMGRMGNPSFEPMTKDNPLTEGKFTPSIPDNTPVGSILALSYMDKASTNTVVETYKVARTPDGTLYVEPVEMNSGLKRVVGREITGEDLTDFEARPKLTIVGTGDNLASKAIDGTVFQQVRQFETTPKPGDDYFTVALALPSRLKTV